MNRGRKQRCPQHVAIPLDIGDGLAWDRVVVDRSWPVDRVWCAIATTDAVGTSPTTSLPPAPCLQLHERASVLHLTDHHPSTASPTTQSGQ